MCVCVCVCVCVYVYVCVHVCECVYVYACGVYAYTHIFTLPQYVFIHTCKCITIEVNNMYDQMMHTLLTIVGPLICTMPVVVETPTIKTV